MKSQLGFTYMGLLMVIAIAGIGMAGVGIVWHQESQREREKELLFIGAEYRKAIGSYYENSPVGTKQYPQTLQELLLDKRSPNIMRHIRKLYADPFAHNKAWNLVLEQGQITGVYSTAESKPIKKTGFSSIEESFSEAATYKDWRFIYAPGSNTAIAVNANPANPLENLPNDTQHDSSETDSFTPGAVTSGNDTSTAGDQNSQSPNNGFETLPPSINATVPAN